MCSNRLTAEQVPVECWQFACGKQVAERTQAVSFDTGVLRVEVPDARWQEQLQDFSRSYLAELNQYSRTRVERIEFVVAGDGDFRERLRGSGQSGPQTRSSKRIGAGKQMAETKVTESDVMYVADLANLELTAEEKGRMIRDLNSILEHIDTLNELDTSDVPPLAEVASMFSGSQATEGGHLWGSPCARMRRAPDSPTRPRWRTRLNPTKFISRFLR